MTRYARGQLLHAVLVLLVVTCLTALLLELVPGDPAYAILGETATADQVESLRRQLNLDKPVFQRYALWLGDALRGDLGMSPRTGQPVSRAILERIPVTVQLTAMAVLMSLVIAIPIGVYTASRAGKLADEAWSVGSSLLISMPHFVSGLVLSYIFAVQLEWFPIFGWRAWSNGVGANLHHAFLPALTLALFEVPVFSRLLRADMVATLQRDFVLSARARGMSNVYVLVRHALRPSSFSLVTLSGLSLGRLLGGAIIVEFIFGLPGLGQLMLAAIRSQDLVMVQGVVLFVACAYVVINAVVDLLYGFLDPRVRAGAGRVS